MRPACVVLVFLLGCSPLVIDRLEQLRETNKASIAQLSAGMPRAEVEKRLGNAHAGGKLGDVLFGRARYLEAKNPQREERVTGSDGVPYDVLFYYTDIRTLDDRITDDELTPLVFRNHELAGIGYGFLARIVPKYAGLQ